MAKYFIIDHLGTTYAVEADYFIEEPFSVDAGNEMITFIVKDEQADTIGKTRRVAMFNKSHIVGLFDNNHARVEQ